MKSKIAINLMLLSLLWGYCAETLASILPPNQLHLQDRIYVQSNIAEDDFHRLLDQIYDIYQPIFAAQQAELVVNHLWGDNTVNAFASQSDQQWIIDVYGGLARRAELSLDSLALVVCHEIGHHLAGFPFKGESWTSSEGQSDYYAAQVCAAKLWLEDPQTQSSEWREKIPAFTQESCDDAWPHQPPKKNLCYRVTAATIELSKLLIAIGPETRLPDHLTPSQQKVTRTFVGHPSAQCRLDTFYQASLCDQRFDDLIIPGRHAAGGQSSKSAELLAARSSCMKARHDPRGSRPQCWYAPQFESLFAHPEATVVSPSDTVAYESKDSVYLKPGDSYAIDIYLRNYMHQTVDNIFLNSASSHSHVQILSGTSHYPSIEAYERRRGSSSLELSLSEEMLCGDAFHIDFSVDNDGHVAFGWQEKFTVGTPLALTLGKGEQKWEIPANDKVSRVLYNDYQLIAHAAELQVKGFHPWASDLRFWLVAPDGSRYFMGRLERITNDFDRQLHIPLPRIDGIGEWSLEVEDTFYQDEGYLESWELSIHSFDCSH